MKIAFLGTKGIPNNYGGFEQFTEYLSVRLVERGHEVAVYNPSYHPYAEKEFRGVRIHKVSSPEKWMGGAANFIYDYLCLRHALKQKYDVIYEAGYHSVAISYKILNIKKFQSPAIVTNMDGIEWKRSKWSPMVRRLIRRLESIAVNESRHLISDNQGIRQYYLEQFGRDSFFIPYGADPVHEFDQRLLEKYGVDADKYLILIARMEPENNIDTILEGHAQSPSLPFLVVGNYGNRFGSMLARKYSNNVRFIGGIYDKHELDSLRHFSKAYFHGHSVGGTNPSLLEAMACRSFIVSNENPFNRDVLGVEAIYFSSVDDVKNVLIGIDKLSAEKGKSFRNINFQKIEQRYNWDKITQQHEELFSALIQSQH